MYVAAALIFVSVVGRVVGEGNEDFCFFSFINQRNYY